MFLPSPTADMPLGVPFPGTPYTDYKQPNWVGYLHRTWPGERPLIVYDFAQGGDTVQNMQQKVEEAYRKLVTSTCILGEHWNSATSLFGSIHGEDGAQALISNIFQRVETTYDTGARAFLFIDVPPVGKIPTVVVSPQTSERIGSICTMWNQRMKEGITKFSDDHSDVQCYQFSSHDILDDILTRPTKYGFTEADATKRGGAIWVDHIHITSAVHKILASKILELLKTI
ncbi:carbohydrate esterase family 16 protein [Ceratobasidium sp. AG-Ba]|nr:carbohydrate esterase family 16 protein [Ceratobasidium sp. AG-Ba]QRW04884.1 carbohydrate esterase family 16 protein [Ceratobasidium sp. AG-Ba]